MANEHSKQKNIIIHTKRLYLRQFEATDAQDMYELNADRDVIKYTGDPPFESIAHARDFIANYKEYELHGYGRWAVVLKEEERFIGWCGLKLNELELVDLGFRFFKADWGKGYATESAHACIKYGFEELGLDLIIGRAAKENKASLRVLEKIGMSYWKQDECKGMINSLYFRITRQDYTSLTNIA